MTLADSDWGAAGEPGTGSEAHSPGLQIGIESILIGASDSGGGSESDSDLPRRARH